MATCPDCFQVKEQLKDNPKYKLIDIGEHVRNLKEFMRLRDASPAFDDARRNGYIGIPCFVAEDGGFRQEAVYIRSASTHTRFSNKASLLCKQGFLALKTRLVCRAKKPCFETGCDGLDFT